jgi:hypothetical protein
MGCPLSAKGSTFAAGLLSVVSLLGGSER